jgi:hypothetical protein
VQQKQGHNKATSEMEELMPELVEMVLSQVNRLGLIACRFVCTTWMRASPRPREAHHHEEEQEEDDWSGQFAANGWLGVLQWARTNGCPWNEATCAGAAEGGHLEVLQWARVNGCPWDESTCAHAALGGHLDVLQWAQTNGCPCADMAFFYATVGDHPEVLEWARANGCPW